MSVMISKDVGFKARLVADFILQHATDEQVAAVLETLHVSADVAAVADAVRDARVNIRDGEGGILYFSQ
jgi:hypothetical protein